jgi:DNA gyrase subunit A
MLLTLISTGGTVMRTRAGEISLLGRATQGVTVMNLSGSDRVAGLSAEEPDEEEERSDAILLNINGA